MTVEEGSGPSGGIQSLDAALQLLLCLSARNGPSALSDLARDCGMPPSKAHRYLVSFQAAGLVEQAGRSGKYDLGPGAVVLGLSALARHDFVNRAADAIPDLCTETGMTVLLSVWGSQGATVIRWQRAVSPVITSMGLGTTLPLLNSATGRAFLAWAPPAPIRPLLETELSRVRRNANGPSDFTPTQRGVDELVQQIRARGYATVDGKFIPGLVAIAAPILDWQGEAQAVVTLIGTDPDTIAAGSSAAEQLVQFCGALSFPRVGPGTTK